jgi:hypothetical protein
MQCPTWKYRDQDSCRTDNIRCAVAAALASAAAACHTGEWVDAVPNVHTGVYGYPDQDSCGPAMAFARTLTQAGVASKVM